MSFIPRGGIGKSVAMVPACGWACSRQMLYGMSAIVGWSKNDPTLNPLLIKEQSHAHRLSLLMNIETHNERIVSIGGWCGVSLVVRKKMALCREAFPFDYILSSFQGIIHFLRDDFDGFFPDQLLPCIENGRRQFAGPHTIFPHHDLQNPMVVKAFKRRIRRFLSLLAQEDPVLFVRASGAYFDEAHQIPEFISAIRERFPALKFRLLFISHYQGEGKKFHTTNPNVIIHYLDTEASWEEDYSRLVGEALGRNGSNRL